MQACLATGASCAIDIHNFARWNGQIIGQSATGPTDAQFADFWAQLASKYKDNTKVIFGLMNEPHDVDIAIWAKTVQAAVTAIRNTGATSQMILLPGNNFASAGTFVSNGSGAALLAVTNPDGSTTNLIMDLHKYLDEDNSGTHAECTTDNIADAFALVATFLKENGRLGLVSETGAGSTASCITSFCAQNTFINQNSDVFLGYIAWAAGSFATDYVLSLTPTKTNGKYVDNELAAKCVVAPFRDSTATPASAALPAIASGDYTTRRVTSTRTSYLTVSSVLQTSVTVTTSNSTEQAAATSTVPTLTTSTGASTTAAALGTPLTNGTKGGGVAFSSINLTPTASQPSGTGSAGQALVTGSADRVKAAASLLAGSFFVALFL
ncbi:endoglucanase VIII [Phlyctema vagabunda]|uniref:cellulase n=1 Tax=Phlyctema vagabunda TaxID=108571 RepID=A0ABR4PI05_9HELO